MEERVYGEFGPADGVVLDTAAVRALDDAAFDEYIKSFVALDPKITPELQVEIDQLTEFEVSVASADVRCNDDEGLSSSENMARLEFEQRFVDENQSLIIAMLESVSGTS